MSGNPLFVSNYHLQQPPCQGQLSPCVDAGDPSTPLFFGTTRTDEYPDIGIIDMGYHYPTEFNGPTLIAKFHAQKPTVRCNSPAQFMSDCIEFLAVITEWKWDFHNDGIIDSEEENPDFTYNEVGNYSVKLIINGQEQSGAPVSDTLLKENYIHVCYFEGGFDQDTTYGWYPLIVNFYDTSQYVNTQIGQWKWDFQDDGIFDSYQQNPLWTYDNPGLYSVRMVVMDTSGCIGDTIIKTELIKVIQFDAQFNSDKTYGEVPLTVNFTDISPTYGTDIQQYQWDFQNDGIIDSDEENPDFTYNEAGNYSVKLIINGQEQSGAPVSDTLLKENYIHVCYFEGGYDQDTTYGWYPLTVNFYDTTQYSNTLIGQWKWDFQNDGIIDSYQQNPDWTYPYPGLYDVKLVVQDTSGFITDTILQTGLIESYGIVPQFTGNPLTGNIPLKSPLMIRVLDTWQQLSTGNGIFRMMG